MCTALLLVLASAYRDWDRFLTLLQGPSTRCKFGSDGGAPTGKCRHRHLLGPGQDWGKPEWSTGDCIERPITDLPEGDELERLLSKYPPHRCDHASYDNRRSVFERHDRFCSPAVMKETCEIADKYQSRVDQCAREAGLIRMKNAEVMRRAGVTLSNVAGLEVRIDMTRTSWEPWIPRSDYKDYRSQLTGNCPVKCDIQRIGPNQTDGPNRAPSIAPARTLLFGTPGLRPQFHLESFRQPTTLNAAISTAHTVVALDSLQVSHEVLMFTSVTVGTSTTVTICTTVHLALIRRRTRRCSCQHFATRTATKTTRLRSSSGPGPLVLLDTFDRRG